MSDAVSLNLHDPAVDLDLAVGVVALDLVDADAAAVALDLLDEEITLDVTSAEHVDLDLADQAVTLTSLTAPTIDLAVTGVVGPRGATGAAGADGPQGPPGPEGSVTSSAFRHHQVAAAQVWIFTHPLGYNPAVTVSDTAGTELLADVTYLDAHTIQIAHGRPTAGYADCT